MTIRACNVVMSVAGDVVHNDEYRRGSDTRNAITELERGTDTVRLFGAYFNRSWFLRWSNRSRRLPMAANLLWI